jgi:hypothetical protein
MRRKEAVSEIDPGFEMLGTHRTGSIWLALYEKFEKVAVFKLDQ